MLPKQRNDSFNIYITLIQIKDTRHISYYPFYTRYFLNICTWPKKPSFSGEVCFHYGITDGSSKHLMARVHTFSPSQWLFTWWPECGCTVISFCKMLYFQVVFIFNIQGLFPVLEEGTFAKNTALNHVSSILVTSEFPHLSVFVPGASPPPPGPSSVLHQHRALGGTFPH